MMLGPLLGFLLLALSLDILQRIDLFRGDGLLFLRVWSSFLGL